MGLTDERARQVLLLARSASPAQTEAVVLRVSPRPIFGAGMLRFLHARALPCAAGIRSMKARTDQAVMVTHLICAPRDDEHPPLLLWVHHCYLT